MPSAKHPKAGRPLANKQARVAIGIIARATCGVYQSIICVLNTSAGARHDLRHPHLVRTGKKSWLALKYGKLGQSWQDDLSKGFAECFRVLESGGVLIFKWNENQIKVSEILKLTPNKPLFGHVTKRHGGTIWLTFMKP